MVLLMPGRLPQLLSLMATDEDVLHLSCILFLLLLLILLSFQPFLGMVSFFFDMMAMMARMTTTPIRSMPFLLFFFFLLSWLGLSMWLS